MMAFKFIFILAYIFIFARHKTHKTRVLLMPACLANSTRMRWVPMFVYAYTQIFMQYTGWHIRKSMVNLLFQQWNNRERPRTRPCEHLRNLIASAPACIYKKYLQIYSSLLAIILARARMMWCAIIIIMLRICWLTVRS